MTFKMRNLAGEMRKQYDWTEGGGGGGGITNSTFDRFPPVRNKSLAEKLKTLI